MKSIVGDDLKQNRAALSAKSGQELSLLKRGKIDPFRRNLDVTGNPNRFLTICRNRYAEQAKQPPKEINPAPHKLHLFLP
jgi:hypothetical protein|tara:strand:- start:781 stop:1020 length:240 start_codon:yes stop_codon:yes gene_type:complete